MQAAIASIICQSGASVDSRASMVSQNHECQAKFKRTQAYDAANEKPKDRQQGLGSWHLRLVCDMPATEMKMPCSTYAA
jgi:hypothetical protein